MKLRPGGLMNRPEPQLLDSYIKDILNTVIIFCNFNTHQRADKNRGFAI